MPADRETFLMAMACVLAAIAGSGFLFAWEERKRARVRRARMKRGILDQEGSRELEPGIVSSGLSMHVLKYMAEQSRTAALKSVRTRSVYGIWALGSKRYVEIAPKTGLAEKISKSGYVHVRKQLCLLALACGSLLGAALSEMLMVGLGLCGAVLGWWLPLWALMRERDARKEDLENHLSEMLEVITLGLRSGLSFDRSFELYHCHFSTHLAKGSASAQQRWQLGLEKRESALRGLAAGYDSPLFSRVIENIVRSLRFGAALSDSLAASALEARVIHKAQREEAVSKAPVKMLVPTAALILPAMLLLVLGPVLLDMMQGF